jgi:hypothetical protein
MDRFLLELGEAIMGFMEDHDSSAYATDNRFRGSHDLYDTN